MASTKLNFLQRGILQKCVTVLVYLVCAMSGAFLLDWLDKGSFLRIAEEALQKELISQDAFRGFSILIEARDSTMIFIIVLVGLSCAFVSWLFMKWAATLNWSWPTTLENAVELRPAMEQLGIADPADRIAFVRKHKLDVFIARSSLIGKEHRNVSAKLYAFAHHSSLGDEKAFAQYSGDQRLCLDAEQFEQILQEHNSQTASVYAAKIVELEQTVTELKVANSLQSDKITTLTQENSELHAEIAELQKKQQTARAREGKADKREADKMPFWRVTGPLVNRLIAEAEPGSQYTRPQIQDAFLQELENFPDLKPGIQTLLHTIKKEEDKTPFSLDGWGMELIRNELGDLVKKDPGATRKG